jgi:hypothetical protein
MQVAVFDAAQAAEVTCSDDAVDAMLLHPGSREELLRPPVPSVGQDALHRLPFLLGQEESHS